jgi:hypothetical protein
LLVLSQAIGPYLVQRTTIRNWVKEEFETMRLLVKEVLANAKSKIHISFDLWTSPNAYAICAIIGDGIPGKDEDDIHDTAIDYSLDGLHPRLDRDRPVAGEGSHAGSITGTNDALGHIVVSKMRSRELFPRWRFERGSRTELRLLGV